MDAYKRNCSYKQKEHIASKKETDDAIEYIRGHKQIPFLSKQQFNIIDTLCTRESAYLGRSCHHYFFA